MSTTHLCATPGCEKTASMACPTCIKLGLPPVRFCDQTCFKASWGTHKAIHKLVKSAREDMAKDPTSLPNEFNGYRFSGELRPHQKTAKRMVPDHIQKPDYADHPTGKSEVEELDKRTNSTIRVYTPEQIAGIRAACVIGRKVCDAGAAAIRVGGTTDEIDRVIHEATIAENAYPSPLNYYNFPKSVCTSVNEVICHGIPDMRPLVDGDIVNLDISVYYNGFHADLNETFFVGEKAVKDKQSHKVLKCAYECLAASIKALKPGMLYRDIGTIIDKVARAARCSVVTSYCGHGIGELFHTAPTIPHYAKNKAKGVMLPGHIFTIEPMINLGGFSDVLWPDGWTSCTADGKRSAQYEHTMIVTETGVELLTAREGEPLDGLRSWDSAMYSR